MVSYRQPEAAVSPPASPRVAFEKVVVTGVSRPMNTEEHWALYNFELHARECNTCRHPHRVQRHGKLLCELGNAQAIDIAQQLYSNRDGTIYSTAAEAGAAARVEIPDSFFEAKDLLRAIERSLRHQERFIVKSRSAAVTTEQRRLVERMPSKRTKDYHRDGKVDRTASVKRAKDSHSTDKKAHTSRRAPEVVEWPQDERQRAAAVAAAAIRTEMPTRNHRYPVVINDSRTGVLAERQLNEKVSRPDVRGEVIVEKTSTSSSAAAAAARGSLYLSDKAELEKREMRESKMAYNVVVREPSTSPQRERRKAYHRNTDERYWR